MDMNYSISKSQLFVLELLSQGYSNEYIAKKLYLSLHTVKSHLSSIYLKLGLYADKDISRRTMAVIIYLKEIKENL